MSPGFEVPIDREEIQSVPLDRILLCPAEAYLRESFADILMICCRRLCSYGRRVLRFCKNTGIVGIT